MKLSQQVGVTMAVVIGLMLLVMGIAAAQSDTVLTMSVADVGWATATTASNAIYFRDSDSTDGNKRFVQVFVVDPDPNVTLKDSILYKSEQFFTDETDMEIRHSLKLTELLEKQNAKRVKIKNKTASMKFGRDIYLEAIKLRDLKIIVAVIAKF